MGQQVFNPVFLKGVPFEEVVIGVVQIPIEVVIWRKEDPKWNELVSEGIEVVRRVIPRRLSGRIAR